MTVVVAAAAFKPPLSNGELVLRVAMALALGAVVGFEREISHQPAGLRTHIAVCLGAALFGIISIHGFDAYAQDRNSNNYQIDVTRVASQVVVGIGFLGGGTILKNGGSIRGLTTAASLWVTAAIGLAAGVGSLFAATVTTVALTGSLVALRAPRELIRRRLARGRGTVIIHVTPGGDVHDVVHTLLGINGVKVQDLSVARKKDGTTIEVDLVGPVGVDLATLLAPVTDRDDVDDFDVA